MSNRITRADLSAALRHLHDVADAPPGTWELETWSPGDGLTRYRIEKGGANPFGHSYWLGANEAYYGIHAIAHGIAWGRAHPEKVIA